MDLTTPACNHSDCVVSLVPRTCMGRRGDRTVTYEGQGWRCSRCSDPDTGQPGSERTELRLLYDSENLYVGIYNFDREPNLISASNRSRDGNLGVDEGTAKSMGTDAEGVYISASYVTSLDSPEAVKFMKAMKAKMMDTDIWNVVNYLRSLGPKK